MSLTDPSAPDLDIAAAAELFGCSPQTIRGWIRAGRLPAYRLGDSKVIRLRRSDIDAVLRPTNARQFDDYIEKIIDAAPRMTGEQRERIAALLRTGAADNTAEPPVRKRKPRGRPRRADRGAVDDTRAAS